MADPLKFSAALFTVAVCTFLAWRGFQQGYVFGSVIFVIIALVFFYIMYLYGSVLKINREGVQKSILFIPLNFLIMPGAVDDFIEFYVIVTEELPDVTLPAVGRCIDPNFKFLLLR